MRKTIEDAETNMAYRWFLSYGFHDKVPHFSTKVAIEKLISTEHVFVDSTHVKANTNKRKFEKKSFAKKQKAYQKRLQEEINQNPEDHEKKPTHRTSLNAATDRKGFVLGTIVTPGNTHDSQMLEPLVEKVIKKVGNLKLWPQKLHTKHQRLQVTY